LLKGVDPGGVVKIVDARQKVIEAPNQVCKRYNVDHNFDKLKLLHIARDFGVDHTVTRVFQQPTNVEEKSRRHRNPPHNVVVFHICHVKISVWQI